MSTHAPFNSTSVVVNSTSSPISGPVVHYVEIDDERAGQRIDNFLLTYLKGVPKSLVYRILRKGEVRVNKGRIKPEYRLCCGDSVRIPPVRVAEKKSTAAVSESLCIFLEKQILFENKELIVINKPAGMAVHGGSGISLGLIEALRQARPQERSLELVHRLDKETSGCLLIAKKRSALRFLQDALRERNVSKHYLALVEGHWPKRKFCVTEALQKYTLPSGERRVRVHFEGKASRTEFEVKQQFEQYSLVLAKPITGRTHQIRVHARHVGCPLVCDDKYNSDEANIKVRSLGFKRLFLHAAELSFPLPSSVDDIKVVIKTVKAELPDDLSEPLKQLF